jgi:hypothetical protein
LRFHPKIIRIFLRNVTIFQAVTDKIRYLADQPNFATDQRIEAAVTAELQSKSNRRKKSGIDGRHAGPSMVAIHD